MAEIPEVEYCISIGRVCEGPASLRISPFFEGDISCKCTNIQSLKWTCSVSLKMEKWNILRCSRWSRKSLIWDITVVSEHDLGSAYAQDLMSSARGSSLSKERRFTEETRKRNEGRGGFPSSFPDH